VPAIITELPTKPSDNLTIIRDAIAAIIKLESANWETLAKAVGREAEGWSLRVYTERANPFQFWMGQEEDDSGCEDEPRIVNVWFQSDAVDGRRSNTVNQQMTSAVFVVDCYGHAVSRARGDGGHDPGDEFAVRQAERASFLARNILMSAQYVDLLMTGTVAKRMWDGREAQSPPINERPRQHVASMRIAFRVDFLEFSPQWVPVPLQSVLTEVTRGPGGELLVAAQIDFPPPP